LRKRPSDEKKAATRYLKGRTKVKEVKEGRKGGKEGRKEEKALRKD
jgi:hypothetical protein